MGLDDPFAESAAMVGGRQPKERSTTHAGTIRNSAPRWVVDRSWNLAHEVAPKRCAR